jgi:hypothetical protein
MFGSENVKGRDHLENLGIGGRIILKLILNKRVQGCGLDSSGPGYDPVADSCVS